MTISSDRLPIVLYPPIEAYSCHMSFLSINHPFPSHPLSRDYHTSTHTTVVMCGSEMAWFPAAAALAGAVVLALSYLIRWIFHPAILSARKDLAGTKSDTFYIRKQAHTSEFSQQIFSPSSCDLTLVIPAYNEVAVLCR